MRNLILSAFPRNMRLPDPFTPNLKARPPARQHAVCSGHSECNMTLPDFFMLNLKARPWMSGYLVLVLCDARLCAGTVLCTLSTCIHAAQSSAAWLVKLLVQ